MQNMFINALENTDNRNCKTENGAVTFKSTLSPVLDLFSRGGAYRTRTDEEIHSLVRKAYSTNMEETLLVLFYLRDIRGGQGERRIFREAMGLISEEYPDVVRPLIPFLGEYGRYDDLFYLSGKLKKDVVAYVGKKLNEDMKIERPSLLAKWMPSINTSSKKTVDSAKSMASALGMSEKQYRKTLSFIRGKIKLVETSMSQNKWDSIEYGRIPSRAGFLYRKAFLKHDEDRYTEFIKAVNKGEKSINSGTLYPYEIFAKAKDSKDASLEAMWKNLPNYVKSDSKAIVLADTSGSMFGTPLDVSLSLALYFAERNVGPFADVFITFSESPAFQRIVGNTLNEKYSNMYQANWDMNTNLQKAFKLILKAGVDSNVPQEEMPETLYIVSDMEFDSCMRDSTNFEGIKEQYEKAGYKLPTIVFWNVNARNDHSPVRFDENGVVLVSGCSPSIFDQVVTGKTPEEFMKGVIYGERYTPVREVLEV